MNVAIIGAGAIVSGFLESQKEIDEIQVEAICGLKSDENTMLQFSKEYNIKKIYYDYECALKDENIDTIYLAVPNCFHFDYAMKALANNKNIIVEKPFTINKKQAHILVEEAKKSQCFVFEAISNQYEELYLKMKEYLPKLKDIKVVDVNYSVFSKRYTAFKNGIKIYPAFDLNTCGGILMDMGVYNIYFLVGLFGKPKKYKYYARMEKGIDTSGIIIFEYDDFTCTSICSKDSHGESKILIQSDQGYICSNSDVNDIVDFNIKLFDEYQIVEEHSFVNSSNHARLYNELVVFCQMVKNKDYEYRDELLDKSCLVMEIIDDLHHQIGIDY